MDKQELQQKLRANYNRDTWKEVLLEMFPESEMFAQDRLTAFTREEQRKLATHIAQFGEVDLDGDILVFLEVKLNPESVHLTRNRVGLRKLVDNEVVAGLTDGALISYYQPETKEWRITFYSERYGWDEDGNTIKEETHPKRYTYIVGPNESCKTVAGQLIKVVQAGIENKLEHVLEAFSVQKISKEFFKEYKEQYDKFVGYLTGKIWTKNGVKEDGNRISQFQFYFKATTDHEKEARDFVKKLLGRIVFLYFVQKKQWLGASSADFKDGKPDFIYGLFEQVPADQKDGFYNQWLTTLFFDTLNRDDDHAFTMPDGDTLYIPFLNGGLFERDETDENVASLPLPGKLFSNPEDTESPNKRGFLDFLSAYNFTIHEDSPGDETIAVDPEMLGHIFENLLEDNKEKGAYYTPKPIVHYMCQESLIEYLLTKLSTESADIEEKNILRSHLESFIKRQEAKELVSYSESILIALKEVKVCDPAIGSGAFPMGILQEIYQAIETLFHLQPDSVVEIWELPDNDWHPAHIKKQIIQHSIYGVDIEKGAVDIARLRFWLSLIVDEDEPTALPNLDYKIVVGDSLVSKLVLNGQEKVVEINWEVKESVGKAKEHVENLQKTLYAIVEKQKAFFEADNEAKQALREEIKQLKIDALIYQLKYDREYFGQKTEAKGGMMPSSSDHLHNQKRDNQLNEYTKLIGNLEKVNPEVEFQHFEWKLDFPEILNEQFTDDTGFDIVIANPPYVKEYTNKGVFDGFRESPYYEGKMDLWYGFACTGIDMLKEKGIECFIAQNNWVTSSGASKMRKKVVGDTRILKLIDFGSYEIFDNASIQTMVMLFQKKHVSDDYKFELSKLTGTDHNLNDVVMLLDKEEFENATYIDAKVNESIRNGGYLVFTNKDSELILEKIKTKGNFYLDKKEEIAQGIVPNPDVVNTRNIKKIPSSLVNKYDISVGDGVFVISKTSKDLFEREALDYIKPLYHPNEVEKYSLTNSPSNFMIYLSKIEEDHVPISLLNHLSKYKEIMEARRENKKGFRDYFELHWPRNEMFFRKGSKILSVRKCSEPTFAYTDAETYVMMAFNIIRSNRLNLKYATGLLNSNLIKYWLKSRGKMQGNNFQIDNEPLSEIPIFKPKTEPGIADLVDQILIKKETNPEAGTSEEEHQIDLLVYKLYNLTWEEVQVVDPEFGMSEEEYEAVEVSAE